MKHCYNCNFCIFEKGYDGDRETPPEPDEYYCTHYENKTDGFPMHLYDSVTEEWEKSIYINSKDAHDVLPELCGHYEPKVVTHCANCKKVLMLPEHDWPFWANSFELEPCCSCKCVVEFENKFLSDMGFNDDISKD